MAELQPIPTSRFYVEFDGITDKLVKSVTETTFSGQTQGHEKPLASTKSGKTLWQSTSSGFEENPNVTFEAFVVEGDMELDRETPDNVGVEVWSKHGLVKCFN